MSNSGSGVLVAGKNLDIGISLREQAEQRIRDAISKYFDGGFRSRVTVEREGTGFKSDCTVHLDTGAVMHVKGLSHDPYASLAQVAERIAKQLRRDKRRRADHPAAGQNGHATAPISSADAANDDDIDLTPGSARPILAETIDRLDEISLEAAVEHLETTKLSSYVFRNKGTGRINILHERVDGTVGWLDVVSKH
jgi:ribosomal subunit interface protein